MNENKPLRLNRREFLIAASGTIGSILLVGCGSGSGGATAPAAKGQQKPVTLEINGWKYQSGRDSQKLVFDMLEKDNPGIKVKVTGASTSDWYVQIKSRFQAGDVPDVVLMEPGAGIREYTPLLMPLDDLIAKAPEVQEDKYFSAAWDETRVNGKVMGLPGFLGVQSPWYNVDILDKLGVSAPPANYDELKALTTAAREAGYQPFMVGGKDEWHRLDALQLTIHSIAPGKLYQAEAGKLSWTDPDIVQALTVWGEMFQNGVFQDGAMGMAAYPDCWDIFTAGKAAMINMGSWATSELLPGLVEKPAAKFMPMYFPDLSGGGAKVATAGVDQLYCIPQATKYPDQAWDVVKWMSQWDIKYTTDSGALPSRKEAIWPDALSKATDKQQLEEVKNFYLDALGVATRRQLLYPELRSGLGEAGAAVATAQKTPQEALAELQKISDGIDRSA